jgi:hypothetical protein
MASHDYVIANGTGSAVRADLNNALAAIVSNNSSSSEPATKYAYQWWADTTTGQLKLRNAANNGWVTIFELDGTMLMEDGTVSAPGLAFASDLNTGFFRSAADKINFATGGVERLEIGSSEVVFNDGSNDVDFRVESNGQTHMLFVDGGNDRVGIGTSSPTTTVDVNASQAFLQLKSTGGTNSAGIQLVPGGQSQAFYIYNNGSRNLIFEDHATERLRIDSSGRLLCGTSTSPTAGNGQYANIVIQGYPGTSAGAGHISLQRGQAAFGANNQIGLINFGDNTGASYAGIECYADADSGTNDYPGRLVFSSTADGASSPTERLRILSDGTIATGGLTATPGTVAAGSYIQHVANAGFFGNNGDAKFGSSANNSVLFQVNGSEKARIDTSGRLLVGTTAEGAPAAEKLTLEDSGNCGITIRAGTTSYSTIYFSDASSGTGEYAGSLQYGHSDNSFRFGANSLERMRIGSNGSVRMGADPNPSGTVSQTGFKFVEGSGFVWATQGANSYWNTSTDTYLNFRRNGSQAGSIVIGASSVAYNTSSDYRLKENVVDLDGAITRVKQLAPKRFNFIADSTTTVEGFLAHEAQSVVPECATGTKDEVDGDGNAVMQGIDQSKLVPLLTAALQEAITKIETLETKVASLEAG